MHCPNFCQATSVHITSGEANSTTKVHLK